ncbi:MAG: thioredoxin domain-containing protein [Aestuariivirgaceae bacterium]|nr:thioredoxin domain-containing protein [Aestuariivirgaceae bacterium]
MNQLSRETSPYLLQHKDNPVHWMAWGEAAFAKAKAENKPILLSVGYAACHWCHVMAHESFEDAETADLMNALFVNVKVDREERPDVDRIYMDALHALGEQGGWPLTMFLAPDGSPFWGGTYFPPTSRYGRPSFKYVLGEVARIWTDEKDKIDQNRAALLNALRHGRTETQTGSLSPDQLAKAETAILQAVDLQHGGLRGAPKFPQVPLFDFLWRRHLSHGDTAPGQAVALTLTHISQGGIYDHLAGGYSRYAVDARWLVPHFEKMLYDNAQLILLMSRVWSQTGSALLRMRIEETAGFILDAMRDESGAFTASYDADSEGVEGKFYVWSLAEIKDVLGEEEAKFFNAVYDVTDAGNWEHNNILNRLQTLEPLSDADETRLATARAKLLARRNRRVPPGHDDKILADWNGLMIKALAEAGLRLRMPHWIAAAEEAFITVLNHLHTPGQLHHSWRLGQKKGLATADDYANLTAAAISLYAATGETAFLANAQTLAGELIAHYWDTERGGFFYTSEAARDLLLRTRYAHDDATPSANGTMIATLHRLHWLTGKDIYEIRARALEDAFAQRAAENPFAHGALLASLEDAPNLVQVIFFGALAQMANWIDAIFSLPVAEPAIFHASPDQTLPITHPAHGKMAIGDKPTLYLCKGTRCILPVTSPDDVPAAWAALS